LAALSGAGSPARQQLIRVLNEQLLLDHIRRIGEVSRPDLARMSRLSKPTVSLALANLERAGLIRSSGVRTGAPGRAAILYEVRPECGFVLGLDVGSQYLRGAIIDLAGQRRSSAELRVRASSGAADRVAELRRLAKQLCSSASVSPSDLTQTVLGCPGVYDPRRDALGLVGGLPGWEKPSVLTELRAAFGADLMLENDIDAAALAERAHGHGRDVDSFAFVSIGTGIGMGLVLGGQLHRGAHGAAGEIAYLPVESPDPDAAEAKRRGSLEAAAAAGGIVRAARRAGMRGPVSARAVFAAADRGDERAREVVAAEALLVAKAITAVVAVADPELIVLGGGVGQASGFLDAVSSEVVRLAPVVPELRVSALGTAAVVDGCLASGLDRAWQIVTDTLPSVSADEVLSLR
jgi:predicted NBD/HSP70 family sugar kinase